MTYMRRFLSKWSLYVVITCQLIFLVGNANLFGSSTLDVNYTYAADEDASEKLSLDEAIEIIDSTFFRCESHVLTPEELANVYADMVYSTYDRLGYVPLGANFDASEERGPSQPLHIPVRKSDFVKSVMQRREFMDEAHSTLGGTGWLRQSVLPRRSPAALLKRYGLRAVNYIHLAFVSKREIPKHLESLSRTELSRMQSAMQELKVRFNSDGSFCSVMRGFKRIGQFERTKRRSHWYNPFSWGRYDHAIVKFADHLVKCSKKITRQKIQVEAQIILSVRAEIDRAAVEKRKKARARRRVCDGLSGQVTQAALSGNLSDQMEDLQNLKEYIEAQQACLSGDSFAKKHGLVRLAIQQIESCEYELQAGEQSRFTTYKKRLLAVIETIKNNGTIEKKVFEISDSLKAQAAGWDIDLDRLSSGWSNKIQQDIYQEAFEHLNGAAEISENFGSFGSLSKITNAIACSIDYATECGDHHEYKKSFDLLDFAAGAFSMAKSASESIAYVMGKMGDGVKLGFKDACEFFTGAEEQASDVRVAAGSFCDSVTSFINRARQQSVTESIGDVMQRASRELTRMGVVAGVVVGVAAVVEAGVSVATSIGGALAAKELLGPLTARISSEGGALLEKASVSVVPVGEAIAGEASQLLEKLYGFSEAVPHFLFAMQGDGGGGGEKSTDEQLIVDYLPSTDSFDEVAAYIRKKGRLPQNYITKEEAKLLGWRPNKGNLDKVAPGKSIGGNVFYNEPSILPDAPGRIWYEADIGYKVGYRGIKRILYSNDGLIFKTLDHYKTVAEVVWKDFL